MYMTGVRARYTQGWLAFIRQHMAVRVRTKDDCDLLILQHPADKTTPSPLQKASSPDLYLRACCLSPWAERVRHKAVCCHVWLQLVPSCEHYVTDVLFPDFACVR